LWSMMRANYQLVFNYSRYNPYSQSFWRLIFNYSIFLNKVFIILNISQFRSSRITINSRGSHGKASLTSTSPYK
jgi:hypothetical protein